jgi:heme/copper-type cytochrome/quinol oxidase subunit 3
MNAVTDSMAPERISALPWDDRRGTNGMLLFIATEAALFVVLFFAWFYLKQGRPQWITTLPKVRPALEMLGLFVASSIALLWGERRLSKGNERAARAAIVVTIVLGLGFLGLQAAEYREFLHEITPTTNAFGSMFYTVTGIHGAHVVLGLLMLAYVAVLPRLEPALRPPHRPMRNVSLYWHFIHVVWIVIVLIVYVLPHVQSA